MDRLEKDKQSPYTPHSSPHPVLVVRHCNTQKFVKCLANMYWAWQIWLNKCWFCYIFTCGMQIGHKNQKTVQAVLPLYFWHAPPPPPLPHLPISSFLEQSPPFPLLYPLFKNLHSAPPLPFCLWPKFSTPTFKKKKGGRVDCVHMMLFCPTRMTYLLSACTQVVDLLLPICDVHPSAGIRKEENDHLNQW